MRVHEVMCEVHEVNTKVGSKIINKDIKAAGLRREHARSK